MRIRTRTKAVIASAMALGLGFVAAPAIAQQVEYGAPTLTVEPTIVTTDGWGDGLAATLSLPDGVTAADIDAVVLSLGAGGENSGQVIDEVTFAPEEGVEGVYSATLTGENPPTVAMDENGPWTFVSGFYSYTVETEDGPVTEYASAETAEIDVIDAELSIDGPASAPVSQITGDGVEIEVRGFQPGETVHVSGVSSVSGELTGAFDAEVGVNGRLMQSLFVSSAEVGETITFSFVGESGELTHTVSVVADPVDEEEEDDQTIAPTPPESVETGIL